jgi:hypothetical protein
MANSILKGNVNKDDSFASVIIRLIPKKNFNKNQPLINDLGPISLTNSLFRLINYAFSQRLMPCANRIISYQQQAFLPGRNIHLHIEATRILAQNLQSSRSTLRSHLFLIDLKKAFDSVDHNYIRKLLHHLHFQTIFIESVILQSSLSSAHILLNNHVHLQKILLSRGVRQGLPFSPVIFNIAIEPLIRKLSSTLAGLAHQPYPHSLHDPNPPPVQTTVNVLAFADDIIIFNKNETDLLKAMELIHAFSSFSNLQMNESKSVVYSNKTHQHHLILFYVINIFLYIC